MIKSLIIYGVIFGAIGFIVYQISKFLIDINNGKSRLEKEIDEILEKLDSMDVDLIPEENDEIQILSAKRIAMNSFSNQEIGVFNTIYSEPLLKYGQITLASSGYRAILIKSLNHEYKFLDFHNDIQVFRDGERFGHFNANGDLIAPNFKIVGNVNFQLGNEYSEISVNDKGIGHVINPSKDDSITTRAFQLYKDISPEEEKILLICGLYILMD